MGSIRVAIVGVGNCASSLVQGVEYYQDASPEGVVPGLMHVTFGEYHVKDVEFVAAFDVDAKKVGFELDVLDVVVTEHDVHQTGHAGTRVGVLVVLDSLDQRAGAVADADDGDADGSHGITPDSVWW